MTHPMTRITSFLTQILPGLALSAMVTAGAYALEAVERLVFGRAGLEALVLAILLGTLVRSLWTPHARWLPGIRFSGHFLLEVAVMLLGVSVNAAAILAHGPVLIAGIAMVVVTAITFSFGIGRLLGLPTRMALLIACGNSICGNSAIAAVAPVIGADSDDVATSIAFTAVLGVGVVLGLPLLGMAIGLHGAGYGTFAGLTVYAVPQVLAAAAPLGAQALQMGTIVKLVRVLMLGPVCVVLSLVAPAKSDSGKRPSLGHLVPWFILGFLGLTALRSFGLVPTGVQAPAATTATLLTVISMAALGLGVDIRSVANAGVRVITTVVLSLAGLGVISFGLLSLLKL
jgi:uncharacterized integral membrane protein (TIGR00698 family)